MMTRRNLLLAAAALPLPTPSLERRVFDAINFQRVCKDAEPLGWDDRLAAAARQHSERMLTVGFFSHNDPQLGDVGERITRASILWTHCGENIFREKDWEDPVPIAVVQWMYSPGHCRNILNPDFTLTGVGVFVDPEGRVAITQQFIRPR